ncbi:hypothetical protein SXCC_00565 [Gluconacetobacter sp. SXCC-1]|nr:hypothetical protein SXCC_00565 [Gluconacetobacter sp. SXCC-1]
MFLTVARYAFCPVDDDYSHYSQQRDSRSEYHARLIGTSRTSQRNIAHVFFRNIAHALSEHRAQK